MLIIAADFKTSIDRVIDFLDLSVATFDLAKASVGRFRSTHAIAVAARDIHAKARAIPLGVSLACEGAYLSSCAQYEQCVRDLIDEAAIAAISKKGAFALLPPKMRVEHTNGCGKILQTLTQDKYKHLNAPGIVAALNGCLVTGAAPAALIVEAFSSNERNFKPHVVGEHVGKLGLTKVWELLGDQQCLHNHFGTTSAADTSKFARERLERIMDKRNTIIHRAKGFIAPSEAETKECAAFVIALTESLAQVLVDYVKSI